MADATAVETARPLPDRQRTIYFDGVRILACIGVIFNHVVGPGLLYGAAPANFLALTEYCLSKAAVPLFFMISGALLLGRVDSYQKTLWRILRIALALVVFTLITYAVYCAENGAPFRILEGLLCAYRDRLGVITSYWFLYEYISVLLMLPLLQRMIPHLKGRDFIYALILSVLVCSGIAGLDLALPGARPNYYFQLPLFSTYIGMLLMGYCIDRFCVYKRGFGVLALIGALACCAAAAWPMYGAQRTNPDAIGALDRCERTLIILAAGGLFYAVKCAFARWSPPERVQRLMTNVAGRTFGAYLVADLFIDALSGMRVCLTQQTSGFFAERALVFVVFLCGIAASAVLERVPGLRKLL